MYTQFFGFSERPFSLLPDPDYLFFSSQHEAALAMLETAVMSGAGFCVLSGEIGAGKTTLLRELLNRVDASITVGLVSNTHTSFGSLMQWILAAYGMVPVSQNRVEQHQQFVDFLIGEYAKKKHTLLIIDEAQQLSPGAMDELRLLSNINSDKDFLLQVIIAGQHELRDMLQKPELRQFAQRISFDFHLEYLDLKNTHQYIKHRLAHAGGNPGLFDASACDAVYENTGGVPRLINRLCDFCLVYAYAEEIQNISDHTVHAVLEGNQTGGFIHISKNTASVADLQASVDSMAADSVKEQHASIDALVDEAIDRLTDGNTTIVNTKQKPEDLFSDINTDEPAIDAFELTEKSKSDLPWTGDEYQVAMPESQHQGDSFVTLDEDETVLVQPHTVVSTHDTVGRQKKRVLLPIMLIGIFTAISIFSVMDISNRAPEFLSEYKQKIENVYTGMFQTPEQPERIGNKDNVEFAGMRTLPAAGKSTSTMQPAVVSDNTLDDFPGRNSIESAGTGINPEEKNQQALLDTYEDQQTAVIHDEIQEAVNAFNRLTDSSGNEDDIGKEAESLSIDTVQVQTVTNPARIGLEKSADQVSGSKINAEKSELTATTVVSQKPPSQDKPQSSKTIKKKPVSRKSSSNLVYRGKTPEKKPVRKAVVSDSVAARRAAAHAALMRDQARRESEFVAK